MLTPADLPAKSRRNFPAGRTELSILELPLDKAEFDELGLLLGAGLFVVAGVAGRRAGRPDTRRRTERDQVLPQRIVRQVRPVPAGLAKARPDRRTAREGDRRAPPSGPS